MVGVAFKQQFRAFLKYQSHCSMKAKLAKPVIRPQEVREKKYKRFNFE